MIGRGGVAVGSEVSSEALSLRLPVRLKQAQKGTNWVVQEGLIRLVRDGGFSSGRRRTAEGLSALSLLKNVLKVSVLSFQRRVKRRAACFS